MSDTDLLHMAALENENLELWKLLRETLPVLGRAFFANHKDANKAKALYDEITKKVGKE